MKKFLAKILVSILLLLDSVVAISSSIEMASEEDIQMLLKAASGNNSANWAIYIGQTKDRAYFEYQTMIHSSSLFSNKPNHIVYWVQLNKLTKEQLNQFKAYKKATNGVH